MEQPIKDAMASGPVSSTGSGNVKSSDPGAKMDRIVDPAQATKAQAGAQNAAPEIVGGGIAPNGHVEGYGKSKSSKRRRRRKRSSLQRAAQPAMVPAGEADAIAQNSKVSDPTVDHLSPVPAQPKRMPSPAQSQNQNSSQNPAPNRAYAALDLGTNNCRLLVAVPTRPGQFRVIDAFSRIVRLGEGLGASGRLSQVAMDRALGALEVCRDKLQSRRIERMRLIATEACRAAENGDAFLSRVKSETGLDLEIVDRESEARLAVSGCGSLVDRSAKSTVLFDIGGGSSEIALIDLSNTPSRRLSDNIAAWTSLPVGVVTMAEKFGGREVDAATFADMKNYALELLEAFEDKSRLDDLLGDDAFHLIGTSGTVTTLAGIHLNLSRYDRRRVDGLWMHSDQVDDINARLLSWSFDERVANPCIGADRADLVLAGCAILEAIRETWPAKRLRVADRGLREGLLTEMMSKDGVWRRQRHRRSNEKPQNANGRGAT